MISYIKGQLIKKTANSVIINANGLGYEVFVPTVLLTRLPSNLTEIELFTYLQVKEDVLQLYGFSTWEEKEFFMLLLGVSGIGPKGALTIMSYGSLEQLQKAIALGDLNFLTKLPGIGKKTAQRLIVELKEKVQTFLPAEVSETTSDSPVENDLFAALNALGYQTAEINKILPRLLKENPNADEPTLIKKALQLLAKY